MVTFLFELQIKNYINYNKKQVQAIAFFIYKYYYDK